MSEIDTSLDGIRVEPRVRCREARPEDGRALHRLVEDGGVLELNSCYSYVLMCDHFAATTVVAEHDGEPVGFVTAYRPPSRPDTVFVWQVGTHPRMRGRGVARAMLDALLARPACRGVRFLEATVTPSNVASRRLFASFARHRGAGLESTRGYDGSLFAEDGHEPEDLIRVGPFVPGARLS